MSVIIGQNKIVSEIDRYSIDTFPRTVLLEGPFGCGKHLLCDYISHKFNLDICDITEDISIEALTEIMLNVTPMIYTINISNISLQEQNILLKFIEEPPANAIILLLTERLNSVIETVINRCVVFKFATYSKEDLRNYASSLEVTDENVIEISKTPGEVLFFKDYAFQLEDIKTFCKKIFNNINIACFSNVLVIPNKISFKDTDTKFNQKCFFRILSKVAYENVLTNADPVYYQVYVLTEQLNQNIEVSYTNVQYLLENYLLSLKKVLTK